MKHSLFVSGVFVAILCASCSYHHNNDGSSLSISESDHEYKIGAEYSKQNTERIAYYLDKKIGNKNNISFVHAVIDAELTLDDVQKSMW